MLEVTGSDSSGSDSGSEEKPEKDENKLTLTPATVRKQYDGTPLDMQDIANPQLIGFEAYEKLGYTYTAVVSGSLTEAGKAKSVIESLTIYDPDHNDVTDSFILTCKPGTIHVYYEQYSFVSENVEMVYNGKKPNLLVTYDKQLNSMFNIELISSAPSQVGNGMNSFDVKLIDGAGNDVSDQYWIKKGYGKVTIYTYELTVKAGDAQKIYDGTPLTSEEYSFVQGELAEGHRVAICKTEGEQTEVGRSDNIISKILIVDAEGIDVTSNYSIKLVSGKLRVTYH